MSVPSILLLCEVVVGFGHLSRTLALAAGLVKRYRVILVVVVEQPLEIVLPAGVEMYTISIHPKESFAENRAAELRLSALFEEIQPAAIVVEYFPFGRHHAILYLLPFLKKVRRNHASSVKIFSSIRDIDDPHPGVFDGGKVARLLNELFDGVLIHSDPELVAVDKTFQAIDGIRIPLHYTNYVSRNPRPAVEQGPRSKTIVVSAGGGRGGEALLQCAAKAAADPRLSGYQWKVLAGMLLPEEEWEKLCELYRDAPEYVALLRWVPDLFAQLQTAAVSVSRLGYNTALDILASRVPALVVPYVNNGQDEQERRAELLQELGALRVLHEREMTPETLAEAILQTAGFHPAPQTIRMDGAERTCELIWELMATVPASAEAVSS